MKTPILSFALLMTAACATQTEISHPAVGQIYWSDGDSGRIDGTPFRLANVDAPETGGVGAAIGGAKCERERELGYLSKQFMVGLTRGTVRVSRRYGPDRYNREVVDLAADGVDVSDAGLESGYLRPWPHEGTRAKSGKPDWCL